MHAMTFAFTQDVPIDAATYARITEQLGDTPPPGLIVHLAMERPEGGLRYLSVWQTEQDCDRFTEERLHPVVHGMLREVFGDVLPPEPELVPLSVIHVWGSAAR
jgi:hypothetical protein